MIFLDNASTTKIYDEALKIYDQVSMNQYFNASALYHGGVESRNLIEKCRKNILKDIGGSIFDNLYFTSGATESDNMAIYGAMRKNGRILISAGEHPAVYNFVRDMYGENFDTVNLKKDGTVDIDDLKKKLTKDVCVVSIMHVSNETGAINDIKQMVKVVKEYNKNIFFHCDGVQAFGKIPVNVTNLGVDAYTISGHKIHGPKGIGLLYVKKGVNLKPYIVGGGQEFGKRSGTENIPSIASLEYAIHRAKTDQAQNFEHVSNLKKIFVDEMAKTNQCVILSDEKCCPYIISVSYPMVKAETLLHMLEQKGIYIGNGSACSAKKSDNRTLHAMGIDDYLIKGAVRISFSFDNTEDEIKLVCKEIISCVEQYKKDVR